MTYTNSRGETISITYYGAQRKMARKAMAQTISNSSGNAQSPRKHS